MWPFSGRSASREEGHFCLEERLSAGSSQAMANYKISGWVVCKGLAREILRDRAQRRGILGKMLMLALGLMAAGLWLLDHWLGVNPWRFFLWWGACAASTGATMLFALYVCLAVLREERDKLRSDADNRPK